MFIFPYQKKLPSSFLTFVMAVESAESKSTGLPSSAMTIPHCLCILVVLLKNFGEITERLLGHKNSVSTSSINYREERKYIPDTLDTHFALNNIIATKRQSDITATHTFESRTVPIGPLIK